MTVATPSFVVESSEDCARVLWCVEGMSVERAEALQKHLAREVGTDTAATSTSQLTRLPGSFNYKHNPLTCLTSSDQSLLETDAQ